MMKNKSMFMSFVLTFLFGPLGLLYTKQFMALVLFLAAIFLSFTIIAPIVIWVFSMLYGISVISTARAEAKS